MEHVSNPHDVDKLARVLAEHEDIDGDSTEFRCSCGYGLGDGTGDLYGRHRKHVAEAVFASGEPATDADADLRDELVRALRLRQFAAWLDSRL